MADQKDKGRRFLVVGLSAVNGVTTGGEIWESDLRDVGANVEALIEGGHLREMEPEDKPTGSSAASRRKDTRSSSGEGDE